MGLLANLRSNNKEIGGAQPISEQPMEAEAISARGTETGTGPPPLSPAPPLRASHPYLLPSGELVEFHDRTELLPEQQGLVIPWVDPTLVFTGGTTGGTTLALRGGAKLLPAFGKGLVSGLVGAVADFPIGTITEELAGDNEALATLVNLSLGLLSAGTIEAVIERQIIKAAGKTGARLSNKGAQEIIQYVKSNDLRIPDIQATPPSPRLLEEGGFIKPFDKFPEAPKKLTSNLNESQEAATAYLKQLDVGPEDFSNPDIPKHLDAINTFFSRRTQADVTAQTFLKRLTNAFPEDRVRAIIGSIEKEAGIELSPIEQEATKMTSTYFKSIGNYLGDKGILQDVMDDYIPHLYKNSPHVDDMQRFINTGKVTTSSPFLQQRKFKTLLEAEGKELDPVLDLGTILGTYTRSIGRVIATREMMDLLQDSKIITKQGDVTDLFTTKIGLPDYVESSKVFKGNVPAVFKKMKFLGSDGDVTFLGSTDLKIHKDAALDFTTFAGSSKGFEGGMTDLLKKSFFKTKGLAKTLIMFNPLVHGVNAGFNFLTTFRPTRALKSNPFALFRAGKRLSRDPEAIQSAIRFGLNPEGSQNAARTINQTFEIFSGVKRSPVPGLASLRRFNEKALWDNIRIAQLGAYEFERDRLIQRGVKLGGKKITFEQASRIAAEEVNTRFGQLPEHWKTSGEKFFTRTLLFAANWTPSNVRQAFNALPPAIRNNIPGLKRVNILQQKFLSKAEQKVSNQLYMRFALQGMTYALLAGGLAQYAKTGTFPWENEEGHKFDIDSGETGAKGQKLYISNPFGRSHRDILNLLSHPFDVARNKSDPVIRMAFEQITGRSLFSGEEILPPEEAGLFEREVKGRLKHTLVSITPAKPFFEAGGTKFSQRGGALTALERITPFFGTWVRRGMATTSQSFNRLNQIDKRSFLNDLSKEESKEFRGMLRRQRITGDLSLKLLKFSRIRSYTKGKVNREIETKLQQATLAERKGERKKAQSLRREVMELSAEYGFYSSPQGLVNRIAPTIER